jgi:hypothetical protein
MSSEIWGLDTIGVDALGFAFPCEICDELLDGAEPIAESDRAHLACEQRTGKLDAHVCASCDSYSKHEITDAAGRCGVCVEIAEEEAREAEARELAVRALEKEAARIAKTLLTTSFEMLRQIVVICRTTKTYLAVHGEHRYIAKLRKLGLVRLVSERVSSSPVCSSRSWVPTELGLAVVAFEEWRRSTEEHTRDLARREREALRIANEALDRAARVRVGAVS